jgi:hypothetical protein
MSPGSTEIVISKGAEDMGDYDSSDRQLCHIERSERSQLSLHAAPAQMTRDSSLGSE